MTKDIPGYEGMYAVDNIGNVYSYKWNKCKMLKPSVSNRGYYIVVLSKNGAIKTFGVHCLVAKTFLEDYKESLEVDHIDRNKLNNAVSNLRMVTRQENMFNTNAKGYSWHKKNKKFQACIYINGKTKYLGYFDTEAEARAAYLTAKEKLHIIST